MNYDFPTITHIDDVLPAIKDSPEFIVVEKDDYIVINYVVMNEETFPSMVEEDNSDADESTGWFNYHYAIRRECRGLIFSKDGELINRRYHKFFNVNERDETRHEAIDWSKPHYILEKLDGSMVSPCRVGNHIRWMTKMGITDTSMEAEVFVAKNPHYALFARHAYACELTLVFEWCSNKNRIVIEYPEDCLILTAIRNNKNGKYVSYEEMVSIAKDYDIPVVKAWSNEQIEKMGTIIGIIRAAEDIEGVVVRFEDGHMVKVKSDWYVRIHKTKALLGNERDAVSLILNNQVDDLAPVLPKEDMDKIRKFSIKLVEEIDILAVELVALVKSHRQTIDRKTFAIEYAPKFTPMIRGLIFRLWDELDVNSHLTYKLIVDTILKHCGSNQSYQKIKKEFLNGVDYDQT